MPATYKGRVGGFVEITGFDWIRTGHFMFTVRLKPGSTPVPPPLFLPKIPSGWRLPEEERWRASGARSWLKWNCQPFKIILGFICMCHSRSFFKTQTGKCPPSPPRGLSFWPWKPSLVPRAQAVQPVWQQAAWKCFRRADRSEQRPALSTSRLLCLGRGVRGKAAGEVWEGGRQLRQEFDFPPGPGFWAKGAGPRGGASGRGAPGAGSDAGSKALFSNRSSRRPREVMEIQCTAPRRLPGTLSPRQSPGDNGVPRGSLRDPSLRGPSKTQSSESVPAPCWGKEGKNEQMDEWPGGQMRIWRGL